MIINIFLSYITSYLLGSLPTAYILGKLVKGIDIRQHGSGNIGATNVFRTLGTTWGIITFLIDFLKGTLAIFLSEVIMGQGDFNLSWILLGSGFFAFLGHLFPVWLKFKGGKGVATTAGVFIYLTPFELGLTLIIFLVIVGITRYVSLGSITSAIAFPVLLLINIRQIPFEQQYPFIIVAFIFGILVVVMHTKNIKRLIIGTENKIFSSKSHP